MRRTIVLLATVLTMGVVMAQDLSFNGGSYEYKRHCFGVELGFGGAGDLCADLGLRWQWNLNEYLAWDVITVKAIADVESDFGDSITPEALSGLRLISPDFFGMTAYINARCGYAHNFSWEDGCFTFEVGAGFNITRHIYVGYAYNRLKFDDNEYGFETEATNYHAFRLGFLF